DRHHSSELTATARPGQPTLKITRNQGLAAGIGVPDPHSPRFMRQAESCRAAMSLFGMCGRPWPQRLVRRQGLSKITCPGSARLVGVHNVQIRNGAASIRPGHPVDQIGGYRPSSATQCKLLRVTGEWWLLAAAWRIGVAYNYRARTAERAQILRFWLGLVPAGVSEGMQSGLHRRCLPGSRHDPGAPGWSRFSIAPATRQPRSCEPPAPPSLRPVLEGGRAQAGGTWLQGYGAAG